MSGRVAPDDVIAALYGDPPLQIRIAAAGGGTLGHGCAHDAWIYDVLLADTPVSSGADLRSGGVPRTHAQMVVALAEHLADTDEPLLRRHRERLRQWASDTSCGAGRDG